MGNIFNHNKSALKLKMNNSEYWDFFLSIDDSYSLCTRNDGKILQDKCLISEINPSDKSSIFNDDVIKSSKNYFWEDAVSIGYTLHNIGYTGVDNGLIKYRRDTISSKDFVKIYNESDYEIMENDKSLTMHKVSGTTLHYKYDINFNDSDIELNGGFLQGCFKTECDKYNILPNVFNNGDSIHYEFVLMPSEFEHTDGKILNDTHPDNKGIFFYIGTRAENKWCYLYDDKYMSSHTIDIGDYADISGMNCETPSINGFLDNDFYSGLNWDRYYEDNMNLDDFLDYKYDTCKKYSEDEFFEDVFDVESVDCSNIIDISDCCVDDDEEETKDNPYFITVQKLRCCGCGPCRYYPVTVMVHNKVKHKKNTHTDDTDACDKRLMGFDDVYVEDYDFQIDADYVEDELDLNSFDFQTVNGTSLLSFKTYDRILSDNKFLLFHRTREGFKVYNWVEDTKVEYTYRNNGFDGNLFLYCNRTKHGYCVKTLSEFKDEYKREYNPYCDLYNNALAFRITDDGAIGYRYLVFNEESADENKIGIEESYSKENLIKRNEWNFINVKIEFYHDTMKLFFYVNGKLKFISKELPKLNLRKLKDEMEKQEMVAYNISLGGGTQGLVETVMIDFMKDYDYVFPLEKYFAGTFIGYIKKFRIYDCEMDYNGIFNNFLFERNNLK